jgi:hypothetical protein
MELFGGCKLPSQEEKDAKEAAALEKLRHFVISHGVLMWGQVGEREGGDGVPQSTHTRARAAL